MNLMMLLRISNMVCVDIYMQIKLYLMQVDAIPLALYMMTDYIIPQRQAKMALPYI